MGCFLAIDQSTSATKALLFTPAGEVLERDSREHHQHYPQPGWVEHDAEEIWRNALAALRTVVGRAGVRGADIRSLSITNQRETIVVFERATGRPLCPAIVWQCRRGADLCTRHAGAWHEAMIRRKTGLKLDPYFSASKLQWLVRNCPDLRAKLNDGTALIGTIDAYLIFRLTGGEVFATDSTNASRTLLFDITRLAWDEELCALWEVPMHALPEVRDSAAFFGSTTLDGALARPLAIRGVMGDSQGSLFAQRCFAPGDAKVTFGTGSSILLNLGSAPKFSSSGVLTALAWTIRGKPTYAFEGIIVSSASTLTWLRDQLGLAESVPAIEKLARAVADNGGVYLIPAFTGLGLPHWKPATRAGIVGLSSQSDNRHVARAAFESIAFQIQDALEAMQIESGVSLVSLRGDGGPTASDFLMQLTADITGVELRVAAVSDCSALGAVRAGQLGLENHAILDTATPVSIEDTVFRPMMPAQAAADYRAGWQRALQQVVRGC